MFYTAKIRNRSTGEWRVVYVGTKNKAIARLNCASVMAELFKLTCTLVVYSSAGSAVWEEDRIAGVAYSAGTISQIEMDKALAPYKK